MIYSLSLCRVFWVIRKVHRHWHGGSYKHMLAFVWLFFVHIWGSLCAIFLSFLFFFFISRWIWRNWINKWKWPKAERIPNSGRADDRKAYSLFSFRYHQQPTKAMVIQQEKATATTQMLLKTLFLRTMHTQTHSLGFEWTINVLMTSCLESVKS